METSDGGSSACWTPLYKSGILSHPSGETQHWRREIRLLLANTATLTGPQIQEVSRSRRGENTDWLLLVHKQQGLGVRRWGEMKWELQVYSKSEREVRRSPGKPEARLEGVGGQLGAC